MPFSPSQHFIGFLTLMPFSPSKECNRLSGTDRSAGSKCGDCPRHDRYDRWREGWEWRAWEIPPPSAWPWCLQLSPSLSLSKSIISLSRWAC